MAERPVALEDVEAEDDGRDGSSAGSRASLRGDEAAIGRIDEAVKSGAGAGRHLASTDAHRLEREVAKDRMQAIPVDDGGPVPFRVVDARRAVVRATADEDGRRGRDRLREPPIEDDHGR